MVELQPVNQELPDWPEARSVLSGLRTTYTAWLEQERQQAVIALQRKTDESARQQAIIARANATPEQKAIEELRDWFRVDRKTKQLKPVGRVVGTLNRLLKEGVSWPPAARQDLAELAEEIFDQKSVCGDDRVQQERKVKIQKLREGAT